MKAILIYLNGRPVSYLNAPGLCRRGVLVRARRTEEPFRIEINPADPKGERRARGIAVSWIAHMARLRRTIARLDGALDVHGIPNVRRLLAGLSPRWKGSRQWRVHLEQISPPIPGPINNDKEQAQ